MGLMGRYGNESTRHRAWRLFMGSGNSQLGHTVYRPDQTVGAAGGVGVATGYETFVVNRWYFVAYRFDPSQPEASRIRTTIGDENGNSLSTVNASYDQVEVHNPEEPIRSPFMIGATQSNGTQPFDGQIDNVVYLTRAITDAEVSSFYNNGSGLAFPRSVPLIVGATVGKTLWEILHTRYIEVG